MAKPTPIVTPSSAGQINQVQHLRMFVAIVKAGSLAAAARMLDVSTSALSQRLRQLETQLGVRVLDRNTRKLRLTDEGHLLYQRSSELLEGFDQLVGELRERRSELAGTLRIFAPLGFGRTYLAPLLADFHRIHPDLGISLMLGDRLAAHGGDRFDIVIHIGDLQSSSAVAYPIAPNARVLCASPAYLAAHPPLTRPEDLLQHRCLVLRENDEDVTMWQLFRGETMSRIRVTPALTTNDGDVVKQWALAGRGLIIRSEWHVSDSLARGELVRALPEWSAPSADVVALAPHREGMPIRVRRFLEYIQAQFRPVPPWRLHSGATPLKA